MEQKLSELPDIISPGPVPFWPPAPGWWLLALLLLVVFGGLALWWLRKKRRNHWLEAALMELQQLRQSLDTSENKQPTPHFFTALNQLLKRSALARYPQGPSTQGPLASLSGADWLLFLLNTAPGLSSEKTQALLESCWQPHGALSADEAVALADHWLRAQKC